MLNVRLYDEFKEMIKTEGNNEDILRRFFYEMLEEENFDLSFYQWCRKNLSFKSVGNIYIYADERLGEQVEKIKNLIESKGFYIDNLELEKIKEIITFENDMEKVFEEFTMEEIDELLNNSN